ncbi:MAG TPA: helix-turn-helix domain-containing protein, partial [Streptosporangiaceae bacterium]|nr:helix-turn-helix domain-containing protein [Streptosporangiaceae bacterium]
DHQRPCPPVKHIRPAVPSCRPSPPPEPRPAPAGQLQTVTPDFDESLRRLIAERRIAYVKIGRHVRIAESDIAAFIEAGRIAPMDLSRVWHAERRVS